MRLEITRMVGNCWKWMKMARHGWNDWKFGGPMKVFGITGYENWGISDWGISNWVQQNQVPWFSLYL